MINIGFRIVRTKAVAHLLGPPGFGLFSVFNSIADLTRTVAGLGINNSGVRQIAEAVGTGDTGHLARTVTTLRRVALYSGALGALLLVVLCQPVSRLTFGDTSHAGDVALLALAVFFGDVSQGQAALVQGMRRIADVAWMNVLGAFYGTIFSIPILYYYRERGVVPSLVCVAAMSILTSWWYARRIQVERVTMDGREMYEHTAGLLKLGIIFMLTGLMAMGTMYLVPLILLKSTWVGTMTGLAAVGYYSAAWGFGGIYIKFILDAMGTDFYPRLTAVANNQPECNHLVNEQAEVGLLLAVPGIIATITFAPIVLHLFYSTKFDPAVEVLRWICLGMVLRVASWPMGFILLAKGERKIYFWTELTSNLIYLVLVWVGVAQFGLRGTGMAVFVMYGIYWVGIYMVVRRLTGFRWSAAIRRVGLWFVPSLAVVFVGSYKLPQAYFLMLGTTVTLFTGIYAMKTLCALLPLERMPQFVQKLFRLFRLTP